jgi:hypothetical protein
MAPVILGLLFFYGMPVVIVILAIWAIVCWINAIR